MSCSLCAIYGQKPYAGRDKVHWLINQIANF